MQCEYIELYRLAGYAIKQKSNTVSCVLLLHECMGWIILPGLPMKTGLHNGGGSSWKYCEGPHLTEDKQ